MSKLQPVLKDNEMVLRLLEENDLDQYFSLFFEETDEEINRLTGTNKKFTKEEVKTYLKRIVSDETRYDFLIEQDYKWSGEIVLNEIQGKKAEFRIALCQSNMCGKGIGTRAMRLLFDFAFKTLGLEEIELDVIVENERAKHVYEKFGFKVVSLLENEYSYGEEMLDSYLMVLKKEDYLNVRNSL